MKLIKYLSAALLLLPFLSSCNDNDYDNIVASGNPVIKASVPASAMMGDSIDVVVNCSDTEGQALSTLKAEVRFSDEVVEHTTIRTAKEGEYKVRLFVPYLQYIPNGKAVVRLTLQNVTTKSTVENVNLDVTRPHLDGMRFITSDKIIYNMVEGADFTYSTTVPASVNAFKGHFETADGKFVFGSADGGVKLGTNGLIGFQTVNLGDVNVTFNTRDYTFSPFEKLPIQPLEFINADKQNVYTGVLTQGKLYSFIGDNALTLDSWFYDTDFFTKNSDGTYTFNALTGTYNIKAAFDRKGFNIYAMNGNNPATMNSDGTGAIWILGDAIFGKPDFTQAQGWWTGTDYSLCMSPIAPKIYQLTLTVGKQLKAGSDVNFKFFGQPGWGIEFKAAGDYAISTSNPWFRVNESDGNIRLKDGVSIHDGETYVFNVDCTKGVNAAVLTVTKK
ncbi:DUF5121 domain-containing protein [Prevotella sp.]|uniref:DUF5121 domain-containing protein n=1 Tax=Prevotella sp. TaxID=59823 RepID=UPI003DA69B30